MRKLKHTTSVQEKTRTFVTLPCDGSTTIKIEERNNRRLEVGQCRSFQARLLQPPQAGSECNPSTFSLMYATPGVRTGSSKLLSHWMSGAACAWNQLLIERVWNNLHLPVVRCLRKSDDA